MNTRPILDPSTGPFALSASFNDNSSYFSVALESGFRVYSATTTEQLFEREIGGPIGSVELVGSTQIIALVGGGKQPEDSENKVHPGDPDWQLVDADTCKVQIWNDDAQMVTMSIDFKAPVQRIRMSRSHLVVVLSNSVSIFRVKAPQPEKIESYPTTNNPFGLSCLGENFVAFPGIRPGQVKLYDLASGAVSIFNAHKAPLKALALNKKGDMIATASEMGTLIRLWSSPGGTMIRELRRGIDPASIFCLAFSPSGDALAITSDKSTLHIFRVPSSEPQSDTKKHKYGVLSKVPILPRYFSDQYSNATASFEMGDEPVGSLYSNSTHFSPGIPGVPGGRPTKGQIGWCDDHTLFVIGAGRDARWEKFNVNYGEGGIVVWKEGWKKYLD